jgi:MFS family permease
MQSSDLREISEQFPEYAEKVSRNYTWNFVCILLDSSFFSFSLALLSVDTILPYFITHLTDARVWVGVVSSLYFWGYYFPQIIGAYIVNVKPLRKWSIFWIAIAERVGILMIAVLVQIYHLLTKGETLVLFLVAFAIFAVTNGLIGPAYADFISKSINHHRGTFYGAVNAVSGLIGFGASLLAQNLLDRFAFPVNLQIMFWIAFACSFISPILILNFREIPYPVTRKVESIKEYARKIPAALLHHPAFSKYLVTRSIIGLGLMANSFYAIYAVKRFGLTEGMLGIYTMIILLTQSVLGVLWGRIGDHYGFKRVYVIAACLLGFESLIALTANQPWWFYLVASCMGGVYGATRASDSNIIFEIAPPAETSRFIGIANTILSPVLAVAPLIGGMLVDRISYAALFGVDLAIVVVALLTTILWLPDPRHMNLREKEGKLAAAVEVSKFD